MFDIYKKVFSEVRYVITLLVVALVVFAFAVWLPNLKLIFQVLSSGSISFTDKISFPISLFGSIKTNFTLISASYTIAIAVLFGINVALLGYYIKSRKGGNYASSGALSVGGLVAGVFGIGCAACGTFVLGSVLTLFGAAGLISFLPLKGEEFGFLGVGLLIGSIYWTTKNIKKGLVC